MLYNPNNSLICGDNYSQAVDSWNIFLIKFSGNEGRIDFDPFSSNHLATAGLTVSAARGGQSALLLKQLL